MANANIDLNSIQAWLAGKKFYLGALVGMVTIAANHYGVLPFSIPNDPNHWTVDEYQLVMSVFARAAIAKVGAAPPAAK